MRYLAIDVGNVLCYCDEVKFLKAISCEANITYDSAVRFFQRFWELHDLGFTTIEAEMQDKLGIKSEVTLDKLSQIWLDTLKPDRDMIEYFLNKLFIDKSLSDLRRTDLNIALLSNIGKEHAQLLKPLLDKATYNSYGFYDACVTHFSCEVGARKPSLIYFQSFLSLYPEFKGCAYIDDRKENLIAGAKLGFKPIHLNLTDYYKDGSMCYNSNVSVKFKAKLNELDKVIG